SFRGFGVWRVWGHHLRPPSRECLQPDAACQQTSHLRAAPRLSRRATAGPLALPHGRGVSYSSLVMAKEEMVGTSKAARASVSPPRPDGASRSGDDRAPRPSGLELR